MSTMACDELFGVVLCVHGELSPSDEEWDTFVDLCEKHLNGRCLVWADGGPRPAQRSKLNERTKKGPLRTAVCSDSQVVRGLVTAFSWFNNKIKAFSKNDLEGALRHLDVPVTTADAVLTRLKKMRASLSK
jgi:hypothetical protein